MITIFDLRKNEPVHKIDGGAKESRQISEVMENMYLNQQSFLRSTNDDLLMLVDGSGQIWQWFLEFQDSSAKIRNVLG